MFMHAFFSNIVNNNLLFIFNTVEPLELTINSDFI